MVEWGRGEWAGREISWPLLADVQKEAICILFLESAFVRVANETSGYWTRLALQLED
jgi:hypothetical protein